MECKDLNRLKVVLAEKKWLEKEENTKYTMLQDDLTRYNDEIKSIEHELKLNNSNRKFKD